LPQECKGVSLEWRKHVKHIRILGRAVEVREVEAHLRILNRIRLPEERHRGIQDGSILHEVELAENLASRRLRRLLRNSTCFDAQSSSTQDLVGIQITDRHAFCDLSLPTQSWDVPLRQALLIDALR